MTLKSLKPREDILKSIYSVPSLPHPTHSASFLHWTSFTLNTPEAGEMTQLKRTRVEVPEPTDWQWLTTTCSFRDKCLLLASMDHHTHYLCTHIHMHKIKVIKNLKRTYLPIWLSIFSIILFFFFHGLHFLKNKTKLLVLLCPAFWLLPD